MNKFVKNFGVLPVCLTVMLSACSNISDLPNSTMQKNNNIEYGSISISTSGIESKNASNSNSSRAVSTAIIDTATIRISGHDIKTEDEILVEGIPVSDGKAENIQINRIPVGKDRIITVTPYDSNGIEVPGCTRRGVTDIAAGENKAVTINTHTTAFGNVLYGIKNTFNFEELENDKRMDSIRKVINSDVNPCLYDSAKLIGELKGFSFPYNATKDDYTLKTASIKFSYLLADDFSVSINDPLSLTIEKQSAANGITVKGIAPGTWNLVISKDGNILEQTEIRLESGESKETGHIVPDGIAILTRTNLSKNSKNCNFMYYWGVEGNPGIEGCSKYPGIKLKNTVTVENPINEQTGNADSAHEKFYVTYFPKAAQVKLIVNNGSDGDENKYTGNCTASAKGVYCVHSSGLAAVTKNSEVPSPEPTPIGNLDIKEEHLKKCFIDDPENKRFAVLFSETLYGSKPSSVKAEFNKGINNQEEGNEYSGTHYTMTRDNSGIWYCYVPYKDVQSTNQSGQPSYNFKVNNNIIQPPSFVPDGYIFQKFNGDNGKNKYLVLVYNRQDETAITTNLKAAKKGKSLKDFDLTSEEGQKQISNFRLTPGTTKLFRSYHPYKDDKTAISDTSRKRMECLNNLATAAGIKADINLSDPSLESNTYGIPSYYQKIIDSSNVLYMTQCSYTECYVNTNSSTFAGGIRKIAEFINSHEGPYQIHCAIGTDRTGVVCAVLAGLCGANWAEIEEDYYKSIQMGIFEYRGPGCIRYSMQHLLGVDDIDEVTDLQKALTDYFVDKNYISKDSLERMVSRLN